jgi:hypothetical protein
VGLNAYLCIILVFYHLNKGGGGARRSVEIVEIVKSGALYSR